MQMHVAKQSMLSRILVAAFNLIVNLLKWPQLVPQWRYGGKLDVLVQKLIKWLNLHLTIFKIILFLFSLLHLKSYSVISIEHFESRWKPTMQRSVVVQRWAFHPDADALLQTVAPNDSPCVFGW